MAHPRSPVTVEGRGEPRKDRGGMQGLDGMRERRERETAGDAGEEGRSAGEDEKGDATAAARPHEWGWKGLGFNVS